MLAPCLPVVAEIAAQRLDAPRHLRRCNDRREGAGGAVATRMVQRNGQSAMTAHGVTEDGLSRGIDGKMLGDQIRQLFRDVAPHPVIATEWRLGGIDIKAGAKPEIVGVRGVVRYILTARTRVRRDKDQSKFGARGAEFAFFGHVGVGTGQTGQIPDHRQLRPILMWGNIDRKGHLRPGLATGMLIDTSHAAVRLVE